MKRSSRHVLAAVSPLVAAGAAVMTAGTTMAWHCAAAPPGDRSYEGGCHGGGDDD